ncbi:MAG: hypothetical protein HQM13_19160 [SAR324 cluster bacterium]|nr:hypothetical protein [SAR324 cluster bacterium]
MNKYLTLFVSLLGLAIIIYVFVTVGMDREPEDPWYVGKWSGINTYSTPNYTLGIQINADHSVIGCAIEPGVPGARTFSGMLINDGSEIQWGDGSQARGSKAEIIRRGDQLQLGADDIVIYTKGSLPKGC